MDVSEIRHRNSPLYLCRDSLKEKRKFDSLAYSRFVGELKPYRVSKKKRPVFERILLSEYISNDILQS